MTVIAKVDEQARGKLVKNHTATHLLHQALKDILGSHVNQAGSLVGPDRLRFDFSHFGQVKPEELEQIEAIVNEKIWASIPVLIASKNINEAKSMGAMALFGKNMVKLFVSYQLGITALNYVVAVTYQIQLQLVCLNSFPKVE